MKRLIRSSSETTGHVVGDDANDFTDGLNAAIRTKLTGDQLYEIAIDCINNDRDPQTVATQMGMTRTQTEDLVNTVEELLQ